MPKRKKKKNTLANLYYKTRKINNNNNNNNNKKNIKNNRQCKEDVNKIYNKLIYLYYLCIYLFIREALYCKCVA